MTATDHPVTPAPPPAADPAGRDDRNVRLAWASLALLPLAFIVPMFAAGALGVEDQTRAPFGVFVLILLALAALLAIPTYFAWRLAQRAQERGDTRGRVPAIIVTVFAVAFLAQNALAWVVWLVEDTR